MNENLSTVLRECILPAQLPDGDTSANKDVLSQCLRTYALIDQTTEAERVIAEELFTPFLNKVWLSDATMTNAYHVSNAIILTAPAIPSC